MKVFTAAQMRAFDQSASEKYKIPSIVLMENAALRVVEFLEMKFAPLCEKRIVVLCGKGNNGGDGFAIARHLKSMRCEPLLVLAAAPDDIQGDALTNYQILIQSNFDDVENFDDATQLIELKSGFFDEHEHEYQKILNADIIIDALLGTGFSGAIRKERMGWAIKLLSDSEAVRIAVDLPSALNSDSGLGWPQIPRADYTITFAAPKRGMFLRDGLEKCGEIWVGDIGTPPALMNETQTDCECVTRKTARGLLPQRPLDSHKGEAGRALLIGGSYGMSGAPILAAKAALKSGAGLCIAALPDKILPIFAAAFPEATSHPLPCNDDGQLREDAMQMLPQYWENVNAVALGPGIGRDENTFQLVQRVVRECPQPLIIDADALYALRAIESDLQQRKAPTILTPHPGEMGELMQMKAGEVNEARLETAIACAQKFNAIVVLKGSRSVIALPDGSTFINLTGNSGMATGGTGDVLTGTIAGLLAQLKNAENVTLLSVYAHGLAGDLAFTRSGNGLIAGDVADHLPRALLEIASSIEPPANSRLRKLG